LTSNSPAPLIKVWNFRAGALVMMVCLHRSGLAVALWAAVAGQAVSQTPPLDSTQDPPVTQLEDVTVSATPLQRMVRDFVESVAAPVPGRKPAAWRAPICVGVSGMQPDAAGGMADRVLDWGHSLGLNTGEPGCEPNIFVIVADNGDETAQALVRALRREFVTGASGVDAGRAALRRFQSSGQPVRWWHVSLPVNPDTGAPIVRLPGQFPFTAPREMTSPQNFGNFANLETPSRINERSRDDLLQVIIVVERAAFNDASFGQVADFVSMAALAQLDPEASPPTPSILHLFDTARAPEPGLTRWDRAYLETLYDASTSVAGGTPLRVAHGMATRLESAPPAAPPEP